MSTLDIRKQDTAHGAVGHIWLNRPELRNAFNDATIREITEAFQSMGSDPDVRVIVMGAHGKAFSAGGDLNWMRAMADYSWDENHADATGLADMLWAIASCPVPVIARVQGDCYGGGVGLVAACDMAVAVDSAHFSLSEVKLGLIPATISPYVIRAMGARQSHRYFLTAEVFDVAEAHRMGFVHEVTALDQLDSRVDTLVQALLQAGPDAVRACKNLLHTVASKDIDVPLIQHTVEQIATIRASTEGRAGVKAFLEKRTPDYRV
ncbi:MAG: enoyl-CoA hydratase/isomerase family protein [Burkholderiales bacterium]|nr:enoyl-CoA hydratase/isomerase family protein [Burkholderiales bacterium]